MKHRWFVRFTALIVVVLLFLNLYVFFTREWESSFSPTSYATLHYPLDVPTIREWKVVERNRLQIHLTCTKEIAEWNILTDGGNPQSGSGMSPSFRIDTTFSQLHTYSLVPVPEGACQTIQISVTVYPKDFYASLGMQHQDVYVVRANVPCGDFEQFTIADWTDDYAYVGAEGLAAADRILKDEVGLLPADPTFTRMDKLTRYLRMKLKGAGGVPKDDERWMNPWILYNAMVDGGGKGWCTQYAQIWVFWANRAGIPTRFVFGARTQDNTIVYTGHAFAESYIQEQHRWAFVDLSKGMARVTDKKGEVLNTAQLFHLNQHNAFDSTNARMYVDWLWERKPGFTGTDTMVTVPFSLCNKAVRDEFTAHSIFKYRRPPNVEDVRTIYTGFYRDKTFLLGNLERYLFKPQLAYSFYPTEGGHTYLLRRTLFGAFVLSVVVWIVLLVRRSSILPVALVCALFIAGSARSQTPLSSPAGKPFDLLQRARVTGTHSDYNGFDCCDFSFEGREAKIVSPKKPARGLPWLWRARFWGHFPQAEIALLERGFFLVYCDVAELYGNAEALGIWNRFYLLLTGAGLSPKPGFIGYSRGGFYAYRWAAAYPDRVACVYADAPVLDMKSWAGGKGKSAGTPVEWERFKTNFGLTSEEEALAFKGNPLDMAEDIAAAGFPMLHICGDADISVPIGENTDPFEKRILAAGGRITVIRKPGAGHRPHSLPDPKPIVDFFLNAVEHR